MTVIKCDRCGAEIDHTYNVHCLEAYLCSNRTNARRVELCESCFVLWIKWLEEEPHE